MNAKLAKRLRRAVRTSVGPLDPRPAMEVWRSKTYQIPNPFHDPDKEDSPKYLAEYTNESLRLPPQSARSIYQRMKKAIKHGK